MRWPTSMPGWRVIARTAGSNHDARAKTAQVDRQVIDAYCTHWGSIGVADPAGLTVMSWPQISANGAAYAYEYHRHASALFLVSGVR
jgi:hypothetical protein